MYQWILFFHLKLYKYKKLTSHNNAAVSMTIIFYANLLSSSFTVQHYDWSLVRCSTVVVLRLNLHCTVLTVWHKTERVDRSHCTVLNSRFLK